jgi:BirA family biotin operon repressor/biotin-[acetyl-CoA-carboxylase] ligase
MKFDIEVIETLGSTMDVLREKLLSNDEQSEGLSVQAYEQKLGRGRHGNNWISPKGNLYISIAFYPQKPLSDFGQMAFVVGLALKSTLLEYNIDKNEMSLKWPNDILINHKKIAGLLLEAGQDKYERNFLMLGAGVNIFSAPQQRVKLADISNDLDDSAQIKHINLFRDKFLKQLGQYYKMWHEKPFSYIKDEWLECAAYLDKTIKVRSSKEIREGIFKGIDETGALLLQGKDAKTTKVLSGEVFFD